ncbi:DUF4387 family protein [Streptosporangium sp. H16]|uniref:DUF4387 family protein n=1 Tax=Streptosporangium sp. H16 TaxID=3444184 RepID=UPI003F79B2C8
MMLVNAPDQATATAITKIANPLMLHLPTADMDYLPSLAFATSPAESERGPAYQFVLNHVVDVDEPTGMFRIPALDVVKISFPRPVAQGSLRDRDIHAGRHHVPLAALVPG